jgi:hypothetical protein
VSRAQCYLGFAKGALLLLWQRLQTAAGRNGVQEATIEVTREGQRPRRLTLGLSVAVLSRRPPGHHPFEGLDLEALAGDVLLIKDPAHFAIDSGLLNVVATAVIGDLEDFVGEVFRLTLAGEGIRAAKFLVAGEPAEYRGFGRHPWVGTDGPQAFTVYEAFADRFRDLDTKTGRTAVLGLVFDLHMAINEIPPQGN